MHAIATRDRQSWRVDVRGICQGVGFRPYVWRLARDLGLHGQVCNRGDRVVIELQGPAAAIDCFRQRLPRELPAGAQLRQVVWEAAELPEQDGFRIAASPAGSATAIAIPADRAPCPDCRRELLDPGDRRYRYPFLNCTTCGPRYSLLTGLPYDRPRTTMAGFPLCADCQREYDDPGDRRFHAQPIACPACGPSLHFPSGETGRKGDAALQSALDLLRRGGILALKGVGGYQLLCDARREAVVQRLRDRKGRPDKPLALLVAESEAAHRLAYLSPAEVALLESAAAPIVLLRRRPDVAIAANVAPHQPDLGLMLPTSPLHLLLARDFGAPLVCTSGNRSGEPLAIETDAAHRELGAIADGFLDHNRPIARPLDDSVARIVAGQVQLLRRARGYAPVALPVPDGPTVQAAGAHLKNTMALLQGTQAWIGPHIGDLDSPASRERSQQTGQELTQLTAARPVAIACDLHPDYGSSRLAVEAGLPTVPVQHHLAHALAVLAEHQLSPPALALIWDGSGLGSDGQLWGGELLRISPTGWQRLAHLHSFPLPGGDRAAREPRRAALGLLWELYDEDCLSLTHLPTLQAFTTAELKALVSLLRSGRCPRTSSVGRLFDGVASLAGLVQQCSFEGQAAMRLEAACEAAIEPLALTPDWDWRPWLRQALAEPARLLGQLHSWLLGQAIGALTRLPEATILLGGGCFQNRRLLEALDSQLSRHGRQVLWPQQLPPNDGGLALGQAIAARYALTENWSCASPSPV